jgi:uncharacterized protein with FMN-binding domain
MPDTLGEKKMIRRAFTLAFPVVLACASAPIDDSDSVIEPTAVPADRLRDGTWTGNVKQGPNRAIVEVVVKGGHVDAVHIVEHRAWKGVIAEEPVTRQIVERQSTSVDVVSGATNSSEVLMKAAQAAVERSTGDRK